MDSNLLHQFHYWIISVYMKHNSICSIVIFFKELITCRNIPHRLTTDFICDLFPLIHSSFLVRLFNIILELGPVPFMCASTPLVKF